MGYNSFADIIACLRSFICGCLPKSRNSDKIWPYSSSRSSMLVSIESPYTTSY